MLLIVIYKYYSFIFVFNTTTDSVINMIFSFVNISNSIAITIYITFILLNYCNFYYSYHYYFQVIQAVLSLILIEAKKKEDEAAIFKR